jgi:hypothetical protein
MPSSRLVAGIAGLSVVLTTAAAHGDDATTSTTPSATTPPTTTTSTTTSTTTTTTTTTSTSATRAVLRPHKALIAGGGAVFASLYFASSLAAADGYDSPDGTSNPRGSLWIPVVGPFIMLGHTSSGLSDVFLVLDGLGQLGGLSMLVYGIATPDTVLVPADTTARKLDVVPLVGVRGGVSGAAVVGSF